MPEIQIVPLLFPPLLAGHYGQAIGGGPVVVWQAMKKLMTG
jgi:hypothetical protein